MKFKSVFIKTFYHPGGFVCILLDPNFVGDFIPDDGHSCGRHLSQMSSLIRMQYVPSGLGSRNGSLEVVVLVQILVPVLIGGEHETFVADLSD